MRFLTLLICFLAAGCSFQHSKELEKKAGGLSGQNADLKRGVPFDEVNAQVFQPRCVRCHSDAGGNKGKVNLEAYENVYKALGKIKNSVFVEASMPPETSPGLSGDELAILQAWIDQGGSLEGKPSDGRGPQGAPPTWAFIRDKVFTSCLQCHSQPQPEAGLDLGDINIVRTNAGKIFETTVIQETMPVPPYPKLTVEEKMALGEWMGAGMPE